MRMELVKGPLAEAWGALRAGFWDIFGMMLRIDALAVLIIAAGVVAAFVAGMALWQASAVGAIALAFIIAIAAILAGAIVASAAYNYIDAKSGKRKIDFSATIRGNALPMLGYGILSLLIYGIVFSPFFAAYYFVYKSGGVGGAGPLLAEFLIRIGLSAVSAIISLFVQFAIFEILISKAGVLEGFARSIRIVRKNLLETIVFSIIVWGVESAIAIPFTLAGILVVLVFFFAAAAGGPVALIIPLVLAIVLVVLLSALGNSISITARHKYWMRARR